MYQQIKWMVKNLILKKHWLNRWLQPIKIRWNQTKTQGKKPVEYNREEEKKKGGLKQSEDPKDLSTRGAGLQPEPSLSFSLTQILSVASVALSLARLYYRRKELMALINKPKPQAQPLQTQIPVRVKQIDLFFCLLK